MRMRSGGWLVTCRVVVVATFVDSVAQPTNPSNAKIGRPKVAFIFPSVPGWQCKFETLGRQERLFCSCVSITLPASSCLGKVAVAPKNRTHECRDQGEPCNDCCSVLKSQRSLTR